MVSANVGWAFYSGPSTSYILRTIDGGHTWSDASPRSGGLQPGYIFFLDGNHAWAATVATGKVTVIWRTADGGRTWMPAPLPAGAFRLMEGNMQFVDVLHGWIADVGQPTSQNEQQDVEIIRTTDGGATWELAARTAPSDGSGPGQIPNPCGKTGVGFRNSQVGWLTGGCTGGITFYTTRDAGSTWSRQALALPDGAPIGAQQCGAGPCSLTPPVFVGGVGTMTFGGFDPSLASGDSAGQVQYRSNDGLTWSGTKAPTTWAPPVFVDSVAGWAVDRASPTAGGPLGFSVMRTTNGGQSWSRVFSREDRPSIFLDFISRTVGWLAASGNVNQSGWDGLLSTSDAGRTWTDLHPRFAQ
jgi:photosystem II stability/assembly factor-like uncharacterized protein